MIWYLRHNDEPILFKVDAPNHAAALETVITQIVNQDDGTGYGYVDRHGAWVMLSGEKP